MPSLPGRRQGIRLQTLVSYGRNLLPIRHPPERLPGVHNQVHLLRRNWHQKVGAGRLSRCEMLPRGFLLAAGSTTPVCLSHPGASLWLAACWRDQREWTQETNMAQMIRFAIFAVSAAAAGLAFFALHSFWTWTAPLLILFAGSILAEYAFNRLASTGEKQRDLEDRVRNPPT